MSQIRSVLANQSSVEPERRGDERSEAARSGGYLPHSSSTPSPSRRIRGPRAPCATALYDCLQAGDPPAGGRVSVTASSGRCCERRACSSHIITWRQQREAGLTPKKRGRKATAVNPQLTKLEQENRRLTSRLQKAEALLAFQKKVSELLQIPLKPFVSDEDD